MGQVLLTDEQLQELSKDPNLTPELEAMLAGPERQKLARLRSQSPQGQSVFGVAKDVGAGALKGVGDTVVGLGNAVHSIPGVGSVTDMLSKLVGPAGTDPSTAFAGAHKAMEPSNMAETVGKVGEQAGEFLLPAGAARKVGVKMAAQAIPDAMINPGNARLLNRIASLVGRTGAEFGSASAVSAAHGDSKPESAGMIAAAGPLAGEGLSEASTMLNNPFIRKEVAPLLAAVASMKALGGITPEGIGAGLGSFSLLRSLSKRSISKAFVPSLQRTLKSGAQLAGEAGAATEDQMSAQRRRLP